MIIRYLDPEGHRVRNNNWEDCHLQESSTLGGPPGIIGIINTMALSYFYFGTCSDTVRELFDLCQPRFLEHVNCSTTSLKCMRALGLVY